MSTLVVERFVLHVSVTADDISTGLACDPCLCPVARAIRRALIKYGIPKRTIAQVSCSEGSATLLTTAAVYYTGQMPEIGRRFIDIFDRRVRPTPEPISFEIEMVRRG